MPQDTSFWKTAFKKKLITEMLKSPTLSFALYKYISSSFLNIMFRLFLCLLTPISRIFSKLLSGYWDNSVGLCCSITIFSVVHSITIGIHKHPLYKYWRLLLSDSPFSLCTKLLQSCPTVWDLLDCSPPGSSVHRVLQARILEGVAMSSLRGSSRPGDGIQVFYSCCIGRRVLYH